MKQNLLKKNKKIFFILGGLFLLMFLGITYNTITNKAYICGKDVDCHKPCDGKYLNCLSFPEPRMVGEVCEKGTNHCNITGKVEFYSASLNVNSEKELVKSGLHIIANYKDGLKDGLEEVYRYDHLVGKYSWKNNELHGLFERYHEKNGALREQVNYVNGKMDGLYTSYYSNGKVVKKVNYINGKKEGLEEKYYENGQLEMKGLYSLGKEEGIHELYYDNGKLRRKCIYKNLSDKPSCECYKKTGEKDKWCK